MRDDGPRFSKASVLGALALVVVLGLIAIPHFQRARVAAREAQLIGDTRAVISAEATFASVNCGLFNDLTRLCRDGPECEGIGIPGYKGPDFISGELGRKSPYAKSGYERLWTGLARVYIPPMSHREPPWGCAVAPLSVPDYCYTSTPIDLSGARSFGGTGSGSIAKHYDGAPIPCPIPRQGSMPFY